MCGIVGFFDKSGTPGAPVSATLLRMLTALGCRGPDSAGIALWGDAADGLIVRVKLGDAGDLEARRREVLRRAGRLGRERPVARIEITAGGGRKVLARRELRGADFKSPDAYEEFELSSFLGELQALEFRVGSYKRADLWIDRIQVEFIPGEWYGRPITVEAPRL